MVCLTSGDEIVMVERGINYGWPQVSEGPHYNEEKIPPHATRSEFTPPNYFSAGSIARPVSPSTPATASRVGMAMR